MILQSNINCKKFYDGIGGIKLINNKFTDYCFFKKPKFCGQDFLSGLFDVNIFRKKGCEGFKDQKQKFLKYLNKSLRVYDNFSYPRTEYWNPKVTFKNLADKVEKNIKIVGKNIYET